MGFSAIFKFFELFKRLSSGSRNSRNFNCHAHEVTSEEVLHLFVGMVHV